MSLIPPNFLNTVVAVGYERNNEIAWGATAFFYYHTLNKDKGRVYLVTNKHVLNNKDKIYLRVDKKSSHKQKIYTLSLRDKKNILYSEHYIKNVDVAAIPINWDLFLEEEMNVQLFHDKENAMNVKSMSKFGLFEGDGVYTIGFPFSVVGDESNNAVVRSGSIARLQDTLTNPKKPFLMDSWVFPGNSGGPVVNKPEITSIKGTDSISRCCLIGIVASYRPCHDTAISSQTGHARIIFEENSGIANVFTVNCIDSVINSYERKLKAKVKNLKIETL